MFLLLPQEFTVEAYNKYREVLSTVTSTDLKPSNTYTDTNMAMDYVYVDIFASSKVAEIEKIVIKPVGSGRLQIDDFTIGLYQAQPKPG